MYNSVQARAHSKVHWQVKCGNIPPVRTLRCLDCGAQAEQYDHTEGYEKPLVIDPVCAKCHKKREMLRGTHRPHRANHRRVCFLCFKAFTLTNDSRMGQVVCSRACIGRVKTIFRTQSRSRAGQRRRTQR